MKHILYTYMDEITDAVEREDYLAALVEAAKGFGASSALRERDHGSESTTGIEGRKLDDMTRMFYDKIESLQKTLFALQIKAASQSLKD